MESAVLEPYEKLVAFTIEGRRFEVPERNSILRVLQFLDFDLDPCRLCWNGDCDNCHVRYVDPASELEVTARGCETDVFADMRIARLPPGTLWPPG